MAYKGWHEKKNSSVVMFFSCPTPGCKVLKVGKSMPCMDEPPDGWQRIEGIPIQEQPIQRKGHLISIFPIVPESGAGGIQPPLVVSSQAIDSFPVVAERGTVARKQKLHIHLPNSGKALKVVG